MPKTKINRILDVLKDNQETLLPIIRRISIGCLIGFIAVFLIVSLPSNDTISNDITRQKFSISNLFQTKDDDANASALPYVFFNKNKQTLSKHQINAIDDDAPRFTLVLNDFGNNMAIMDSFGEKIEMPVTLGLQSNILEFNPTATALHNLGYEIWLNVQTITANPASDHGNTALNPVRDFDFNITLLEQQMNAKALTTGIMINPASLLTQSADLWGKITNDLFAQGYGVFDTTPTAIPTTIQYLNDAYAPYLKNNIVVDTNVPLKTLESQLAAIEQSIRINKNTIVTTSIYTPAALDIIAQWVNSLTSNGIIMIPLSAQANL